MQVPFVSLRTIKTQLWCVVIVVVVTTVAKVASLNGPNVCMVKQKYNITKRVKYRAPMSVRTYEWCFSMPPRCSRWNTEMRELTRLETDERTAEVAVCCPGYKMKDVSCVPICPNGKTGPGCADDCPENKWGPNCVNNCTNCADHGKCSPVTGECECEEGWQGESCESRMSTTQASTTLMEEILTTIKSTTNTNPLPTTRIFNSATTVSNTSTVSSTAVEITTLTPSLTSSNSPSSISTTTTSPVSITSTIIDPSIKEKASTTEDYLITSERNIEQQNLTGTEKTSKIEKSTTSLAATTSTHMYDNVSTTTPAPTSSKSTIEDTTSKVFPQTIYNRTETPIEIDNTGPISESTFSSSTKTVLFTTDTTTYKAPSSTMKNRFDPNANLSTITTTTENEYTTKSETTRKPDIATKAPSTIKLKPKEIWIKPTQKEPEHITAVMSDKERDRSSMDLISVVSIAGGVMMAVITVAILIVMIERCRRPRFEDVRKVNDIRMQVMIDNSDSPPPYTRSIFHTPLPEPPSTEKCHYQPISTLDRNLKQFMRPVVVQNISPIMLENFRGILECHYDHLPRRNHDFGTMPPRFVTAPSISYTQELRYQKSRSVTDSTIDSLRCEAKLDAIDSTTSEPLYAEIPCWRPPSEHAIEVVNLNGEAITEL